jgi:uncharacterized lipoprotein YmbA
MTVQMMRPVARLLRLLGAGFLFSLAGCFTLARPTPPLEEYVLGNTPGAAAASPAREAGAMAIGLRRLDLAPYLAMPAIVVRRGSRIVASDFRRWGEEPSAGVMRAVAASLATAPAILSVDVAPWPVQARHDYLIQLHVSSLEGVAPEDSTSTQGAAHVMASWEIIRSQDGALVARGATDRRETGWKVGDYRGLVDRIERGLTGLAGDLTACLVRLGPAASGPDAALVVRPVVCPSAAAK